MWWCKKCFPEDSSLGICVSCVNNKDCCGGHKEHLVEMDISRFTGKVAFCDCEKCTKSLPDPELFKDDPEKWSIESGRLQVISY